MSNFKFQIKSANRQSIILTMVCALGLIAVVLAAVMVNAQRRVALCGIPEGFPQPIAYPDLPRWGVNVALEQYDDAALRQNLEKIRAVNFAWVRQTFPWAEIEPERGQFDWATWDRIVSATTEGPASGHGQALPLHLIAVLDTSPAWSQAHPPTAQPNHPPLNMVDFARFAAEFARRYGDRIDYYQVWDEPNLGDRWNGEVDAAAYAEMLRQAREAILANDPHAVILLAGLAPTIENSRKNTSDWLYLRQLYEASAGKYFDIASGKPYGYSTGPDDRRVSPDVLNFSHVILMREEMVAHGDAGKPLWASHFGWNALPQGWSGKPSAWGQVTESQQADYTFGALRRVPREWPWMGVMVWENWQPAAPLDDPHWGFAVAHPDGIHRVADAFEKMSSASDTTTGYHPAAQPVSIGSSTFVAGSAEFSPLEHWRFSELGVDWKETGDNIKLTFHGTGLALRVRRAADRAAFYITIDGQPANALPRDSRGAFLQLIPPDIEHASVDTVPVATGLTYGLHTAEIVADRGWNQWALVGWSVQVDPSIRSKTSIALTVLTILGFAFVIVGACAARRVMLDAGIAERLRDVTHAALMAATTVTFYASAWMTWGQQIPAAFRKLDDGTSVAAALGLAAAFYFSPWLVVTLLSGLALFLLILMRLDLGLALAVLVIPFYMLPRELYERVFSMAEIVVVMCAVAWLPRLVVTLRTSEFLRVPKFPMGTVGTRGNSWNRSVLDKLSTLDWATSAFLAVAVASLFVADYQKFALREFRVIVFEPILLYAMLRTTLHSSSEQDRSRLIWRCVDALMLAGVIVAVVGLIQYTFNINLITAEAGQHRLRSVYGSPNNVGLFLGRVLPVMVAVALLGRGRRRWLYGAAVVPVALAIVLSFSKGALLMGVPAALLVIGVLVGGRWLWAVVAAIGAGGLAMIPLLRTPRFQSLLDLKSGTSFFRLNLWQSALLMVREHPILGVGLDNFLYQYRGRYLFPAAWAEPNLSHPHNVILDYATRMGVLGLAAGVWLQVAFWRAALPLRKLDDPLNRALAIGLMASMADFLAHGLVDASYFVIDLAYVFFITLAVVQALAAQSIAPRRQESELVSVSTGKW